MPVKSTPEQVRWSLLAESDFAGSLEYLHTNWGNAVVIKFIDIVEEIVSQIQFNPRQFPVIQKKMKIRKCVITKHNTLYYQVKRNHINVLRIYDNRQDPKKLKF